MEVSLKTLLLLRNNWKETMIEEKKTVTAGTEKMEKIEEERRMIEETKTREEAIKGAEEETQVIVAEIVDKETVIVAMIDKLRVAKDIQEADHYPRADPSQIDLVADSLGMNKNSRADQAQETTDVIEEKDLDTMIDLTSLAISMNRATKKILNAERA